ncbi:MAG: putative histidine kinase, hybrid [Ramlibacter sp.]|nr:putative histidine kinase, hybrid [Ramlibacter sp.]
MPLNAGSLPGLPETEVGRLFRGTDWGATELGPIEQWPHSLRTAASICLNSRFPIFIWWGPSLINIYNDAYVPILGSRHPEGMGRSARALWHEAWTEVAPQVEAVMQRGEASWNERVPFVLERRGFAEKAWFTWSYSPIYKEDGSIGGLFCAVSEDTARVNAELERDQLIGEAQDAARTLRTWFDNAPGFIALLRGPDFVFEMVNQAYYQLVGHRQIEGLPAFEALPEARSQGFEDLLKEVVRSGKPFIGRGVRFLAQREPGAAAIETFVDLIYQPVVDAQGQVVGVFAQGHDVTEQVRAVNSLKEADRRKDEFVATLAHELRNPLAPIRQAAMVAKSDKASDARRRWALDIVERQVGHMALLLDDLLDVSRISRGKLDLRRETVDLSAVVEAAIETARPAIEAKGHQLQVKLPAQPVQLSADRLRLAQVLSNLLSNAAKYTDKGGRIELNVEVAGLDLVLRVRDNGIGLAPESQRLIFEMFSQVSSALERSEGGLGIGLALSRGLVALHGGRLEVFSAGLGQGAEFSVILPLR